MQIEDALLSDASALGHRVGASLQRTDRFGRVLTPKEAFRDVSYAFHGYVRAASKKEKSLKSLRRERAAEGLVDEGDVTYLQSKNPSQLVDDFKARKWKPKYRKVAKKKKGESKVAPGKRDFVDRFVAQAAAAAAQQAAASAAAQLPHAVALSAKNGAAAGTGSKETQNAAADGKAANGKSADGAALPPPPPPVATTPAAAASGDGIKPAHAQAPPAAPAVASTEAQGQQQSADKDRDRKLMPPPPPPR